MKVDDLLLSTMNTKVFCKNWVEFADILDKVMINIWGEVEECAQSLIREEEINQLLIKGNNEQEVEVLVTWNEGRSLVFNAEIQEDMI